MNLHRFGETFYAGRGHGTWLVARHRDETRFQLASYPPRQSVKLPIAALQGKHERGGKAKLEK